MARGIGLLAGVLTHLLFGWTVYRLFPFLQGNGHGFLSSWVSAHSPIPWYVWNVLLAVQFAIIHSLLLHPKTRKRIERLLPSAFYSCFFCVATCLCLLTVIEFWQPQSPAVWRLTGTANSVVHWAYIACWPLLIYTLSLTGLGYQTGWTPWWAWVRGVKPPRRAFETRSLYRVMRHPIYVSFLGMIWFTPDMTIDRALLTGLWTVYIYVGSCLKDRRLLHYIGEPYRQYQSAVPGYPFMIAGPLAKVRLPNQPLRQSTPIGKPAGAAA
jgi:methanethiol S-methyltransferase